MTQHSSTDDFASAFNEDDTAAAATVNQEGALDSEHDDLNATAGNSDTDGQGAAALSDEGEESANQGTDEETHAASAQPEATPATDWETEAKRWKDRYSSLQGKYNAEVARGHRGNGNAAPSPAPAVAPAAAAPQTSNDDDEQLLAELDEQLPTVAKAVRKLISRERQAIEESVFGRIAPIESVVTTSAQERHFAAIRGAHADFDAIQASPDLAAWVDEQPSYLASSFRSVMEQGTAEDVIDLLARFKKETGRDQPAPAPQPTPAAQPSRAAALRSAAAPRLRAAPAIPRTVDKGDFGAAWAE